MKKIQDTTDKHSSPGSKAGPRRQWIKERKQQLLHAGTENEVFDLDAELEYGYEDALIEDIMGNTSHLTSQPTPQPIYLGNAYPKYYKKVAGQMQKYREAIDVQGKKTNEHEILDVSTVTLPSDKAIAGLLRSYRDLKGSRNKPIGIVMALQHLLTDIGVPTTAFGEYSYTSLLTCCRSPKEARRIFKLMRGHRHPISSYSWSILVDIHAKVGDYEGCAQVIEEMASEGVAPTQAAYTSLLAACHKVCNDGRIPHSIRAKAGKVGWSHWQQMRIVGIEADSMAFGAVIRLCAARGQPERAINLLEEMHRFDIKPTTLCFSSALRAVARSHEIGTRFEHGDSKKQLRRETFAAHHGKMAREIVIKAEISEVELDDGFISALMLCAAAAGDSATAKAVFLASEVRKMDHLRTIGSESHLSQLRGEVGKSDHYKLANGSKEFQLGNIVDGKNGLASIDDRSELPTVKNHGEREYGKDTRSVSALLHSCAKAVSNKGIGTIWAGKENQGYLCENSLRLITTRWEPSYRSNSISGGESNTKVGISQLQRYDDHNREEEPKPGKRKKFRGMYVDDDAVLTAEDIDEYTEEGDELEFLEKRSVPIKRSSSIENEDTAQPTNINEAGNQSIDKVEELTGRDEFKLSTLEESDVFETFYSELKDEAARNGEDFDLDKDDAHALFEMMHNETEFQPIDKIEGLSDEESFGLSPLEESDVFETFYSGLKDEAERNEEEFDLDKDDARELFKMMQNQFAESFDIENTENLSELKKELFESSIDDFDENNQKDYLSKEDKGEEVANIGSTSSSFEVDSMVENDFVGDHMLTKLTEELEADSIMESAVADPLFHGDTNLSAYDYSSEEEMEQLKELQEALPGMPVSRLKRVLNTFNSTLGYPSMIKLVPILRETMPDKVTNGWLKRMNTKTAEFAFQKAEEDGLVNTGLLNSMLQVQTSSGSLDKALKFHANQYRKHRVVSISKFSMCSTTDVFAFLYSCFHI
jgi:pentatricopeptide repeat protein